MITIDAKIAGKSTILRFERHPSETVERVLARAVAYLLELEYTPKFTSELCQGDKPDLTSDLERRWIDVDIPSLKKVRHALKAANVYRICAYRKDEKSLIELRRVLGEREELILQWIDLPWSAMAAKALTRMQWQFSRIEQKIQVNEWHGVIHDY